MAYYRPGMEPEKLKKQMAKLFENLNSAYPDKNVVGLHNDHKHWGETVTKLYRELGYPDGKSFLEAYGYKYGNKELGGGRPKSVDPDAVIKEFQKKYPNGSPFKSVDELFAGTEYAAKLKTIKNSANDVFGMPLGKYLVSIGLIQSKAASKTNKKKNYIICKVLPTAVKNPIYCMATSKSIHEGDIVEVPMGIHDSLAFAQVQEVFCCDKESAPCDIDEVKTINRKLGVREYTAGLLGSILRANAAIDTNEVISNASVRTFSASNNISAKVEGKISWACCRGLAADVIRILDYLVEKDNQVYEYKDLILIGNGISELYVFGDDVLEVLEKYPEVKMVMFSENSQSDQVYLCYSKSGYSTVTDTYVIGECDTKSKSRWTLKNSPLENFNIGNIEYTFRFSDDWESLNYVFTDGNGTRKQLGK